MTAATDQARARRERRTRTDANMLADAVYIIEDAVARGAFDTGPRAATACTPRQADEARRLLADYGMRR